MYGISLFDSSYEYQEQLTWSGFNKPWVKTAVDSGAFIGIRMTMMPVKMGLNSLGLSGAGRVKVSLLWSISVLNMNG